MIIVSPAANGLAPPAAHELEVMSVVGDIDVHVFAVPMLVVSALHW